MTLELKQYKSDFFPNSTEPYNKDNDTGEYFVKDGKCVR